MTSRWVGRVSAAALAGVLLLIPVTASAQQASGIAGLVRDASGGVLPGVTVEAASPALIEKLRSVVTDGQGRYNIVDLRPGTYVVTFTLTGFNTFKREGVVLTAGFTAGVNADMQVGALEETITVTGAAPLVDTQNVKQQKVISEELLAALPSGAKGFMGIARLIPGMSGGGDSGGASGLYSSNIFTAATLHGKGGGKMSYDGMQTSNLSGGVGAVSYIMNPATVEETVVETGGISAESDANGIRINLIPKEGGNVFKFGADSTYTNRHLQGDNLSDTLRARGLLTTSKVLHVYDVNVTVGGPVKKDRLWFFAGTRFTGNKNQVLNVYFNKTRGTPFYTPDLDRPSYRRERLKSQAARITWQVSPKHKVSGFADTQSYMVRGRGDFSAPEAHTVWSFWPNGLYQVVWSSPTTSKLLFEAGASLAKNGYPYTHAQSTDLFGFTVPPTDVSILEASTGFRYNARNIYANRNDQDRYVERFSASYVTGSHAFKAGFQVQQGVVNQETVVNSDGRNASCNACPVQYTFLRGVPIQLTQWATPYLALSRTKADLGLFAQDQWTVKRLTLNYGLRLDYFNGYVAAQHVDAGPFVGTRDFAPVYGVPEWTDLNPRVGASYNLFGDGRTALKASLGRYVGKMSVGVAEANNPIVASVNSVTRAWSDADGNYIPGCDLRNFGANGECGPISNVNFGKINPNAVRYADDLIRGFRNRDYFWDVTAEVQHQFGSRVSVTGGYYRNWTNQYGLLIGQGAPFHTGGGWPTGVNNNQAVTPADFSPYCITAPLHPELPGGGGYPVCGLYDVAPAKFGQGAILVDRASNYDNGKRRTSNFFTGSVNTRLGGGIEFGGSLDTGRIVEDNCFLVDSPQELLNCRIVAPFKGQTQIKVYGNYPLPGGFVVSGVLQNLSGTQYEANYDAPNALIAPSLGRNLAACGTRAVCSATARVPLIRPWTQFEPRRTLLDLRASKVFSVGPKMRLRANFDAYNVLNSSAVLFINSNFGSFWRQPVGSFLSGGLVDGRLIQLGGQLTF